MFSTHLGYILGWWVAENKNQFKDQDTHASHHLVMKTIPTLLEFLLLRMGRSPPVRRFAQEPIAYACPRTSYSNAMCTCHISASHEHWYPNTRFCDVASEAPMSFAPKICTWWLRTTYASPFQRSVSLRHLHVRHSAVQFLLATCSLQVPWCSRNLPRPWSN